MNYAVMPVTEQLAVVSTEVGGHLPRVQEAARMWRAAARQLAEVSESLSRELESVAPHWQDATGTGLLARGLQRKQAVDNALARITEHQPWRALDDLARQLLLTEARMAAAAERATASAMCARVQACGMVGMVGCACQVEQPGAGEPAAGQAAGRHGESGAHLAELDRYFQAAADAVLRSAGLESALESVSDSPQGDLEGASPASASPALAGDPGSGLAPGALAPAGSALPPGAVTLPGLVAVPPGAASAGRRGNGMGGLPGRGLGPAGAFDSSRPASPGTGGAGDGSGPGGQGAGGLGGAAPGASPDVGGPEQIERVADPPEDTGPTPAPEPPAAPDRGDPSTAGAGGTGLGGFFPPMMFPPMMGMGLGGAGSRQGGARTVGGNDRPTKARPNPTPGVPARLRGRSGLADPATNGFRSPASAGKHAGAAGRPSPEPLEHEMWEVAEPTSASPLKPDVSETPHAARRPNRRAL